MTLDAREKRLASAVFSSLAGRFATLIAPLLATPAILNYFGDADYGLWAVAISFTHIAVVADLGIGNGLHTRVAAAYGAQDNAAIRTNISNAFTIVAAIAGSLLFATVLGFWLADGPAIPFVVFAAFFIGMPGTVFYQVLFAVQRVPDANAIQVAGAIGAVAMSLIAVHLMAPNWAVALAYAAPIVLAPYIGAALYFWTKTEHRPTLGLFSRESAIDILQIGSAFFVLSLIMAVMQNIDNIIISKVAGNEAVAAFTIPMRLGALLGLVIFAIYMPLWGSFGEALSKREFLWVRRSVLRMSIAGTFVVSSAGIALVFLSDWIIWVWVGRQFDDQNLIVIGFVLLSIAMAATSPSNMVLNALGKVGPQIRSWLSALIVSTALKIWAASHAVWLLPMISAATYAIFVAPMMIFTARYSLSQLERSSVKTDVNCSL